MSNNAQQLAKILNSTAQLSKISTDFIRKRVTRFGSFNDIFWHVIVLLHVALGDWAGFVAQIG